MHRGECILLSLGSSVAEPLVTLPRNIDTVGSRNVKRVHGTADHFTGFRNHPFLLLLITLFHRNLVCIFPLLAIAFSTGILYFLFFFSSIFIVNRIIRVGWKPRSLDRPETRRRRRRSELANPTMGTAGHKHRVTRWKSWRYGHLVIPRGCSVSSVRSGQWDTHNQYEQRT